VELLSFFGVVGVLGQPLPLPSSSNNPPLDSSQQARWEAFDEGVLLEGWPVTRDFGLESSIRGRITSLENSNCVFLLDKPRGDFWNQIREGLESCTTQKEYNALINFENRDLQVREQGHSCYVVWGQLLSEHPALAGRAAYDPLESIRDFFNEQRDSIDRQYHLNLVGPQNSNLLGPQDQFFKPSGVDMEEVLLLQEVERDLRDRGVNSVYIRRLLGLSDP
jgi:hypothetical protein